MTDNVGFPRKETNLTKRFFLAAQYFVMTNYGKQSIFYVQVLLNVSRYRE